LAILYPGIQSITGFPRKFKITEDVQRVNWATVEEVEALGESVASQISELQVEVASANISHAQLLGIGTNDHHDKSHGDTHNGDGSDSFQLPFEFKDNGDVVAKIDINGNVYAKGRFLKLQ